MNNRRGMYHDTEIDASERRRSSLRYYSTDTISILEPFGSLFICHCDKVAKVRRVYALFWRLHKSST